MGEFFAFEIPPQLLISFERICKYLNLMLLTMPIPMQIVHSSLQIHSWQLLIIFLKYMEASRVLSLHCSWDHKYCSHKVLSIHTQISPNSG